jgi:glycosyltransferase involved in cell wall biosynthesis
VASPSSLGTIAEGIVAGQHLVVAANDAAMVDAIVMMLRQPIVAGTLARNARELIERRYSWPAVTAEHEAVLARVTGREAARPLKLAA